MELGDWQSNIVEYRTQQVVSEPQVSGLAYEMWEAVLNVMRVTVTDNPTFWSIEPNKWY